ncbi:hypothetical protein F8388_015397 [Cannabis sativa]|uniref:Uncharacterized protein n=1 Tax=Cannabis sativa TaxID=3483 RepID=A0A7J6GK93_CANSA|nr:hypothetical protein F8388_015397 [Cannabis sativa]
MVRTPCCDQNGMKKGTWTPEEDRKLVAYVTRYGCWNWRQLPKFAGLKRCGKSCRLRWMNYLRPNVKRGNYTHEEEETITRLHASLGNKWSAIAAELPGRTDNEVKNYWHTNLKKRQKQNSSSVEISQLEKSSSNSTANDQAFQHELLSDSFWTEPFLADHNSYIPTTTTHDHDYLITNANSLMDSDDLLSPTLDSILLFTSNSSTSTAGHFYDENLVGLL